jgi:hypothetical protein
MAEPNNRRERTTYRSNNNIFMYIKIVLKKCIIEPFIIFMLKPASLKKFISVNKLLFAEALSSFSCSYHFAIFIISLSPTPSPLCLLLADCARATCEVKKCGEIIVIVLSLPTPPLHVG